MGPNPQPKEEGSGGVGDGPRGSTGVGWAGARNFCSADGRLRSISIALGCVKGAARRNEDERPSILRGRPFGRRMHGEADAGLFCLRARAAKGGHRLSAGTKESRDRPGLGQAWRMNIAVRAGCGRRDFRLCSHVQ